MKTKVIFLIIVLFFFALNSLNAQVVEIQWNTFLGSANFDYGYGIAVDSLGNSFVSGNSGATWGTPVNTHSGGDDIVVASLDGSGNLIWNTFMGSVNNDYGKGMAVDNSGNIYIVGYSDATWGSPINAHSGGIDAFVACLDSSGNLIWNTFLGASLTDYGNGIAVDSSGNIFVTGQSNATWGSPVNAYSSGMDVFVASMDNSGNLLWNTFLGSFNSEYGQGIALNGSGNIYLVGKSYASWGSPVNAHSGSLDAFVACVDSSGNMLWNTFFGSAAWDEGNAIVLGNSGNIYLTGNSNSTWGSPVHAHSGGHDAFVAYLDSSGNLQWNTFFGSSVDDMGHAIALDNSVNIYMTGQSYGTWGSPVHGFNGASDSYVACLDGSGQLLWNTFLGCANIDYGFDIVSDNMGNICVAGFSNLSWGTPINAHSGNSDIFVAELSTYPDPNITANGSDGPISITQSDTLQIRVSLNTFGSTANADFWLAYKGPSGWVHYNKKTKSWDLGLGVTHQGALFDLNNKRVFQASGLSLGTYRFYFGVDMNMDGNLTKSCLYYDEVKVTVTSD